MKKIIDDIYCLPVSTVVGANLKRRSTVRRQWSVFIQIFRRICCPVTRSLLYFHLTIYGI